MKTVAQERRKGWLKGGRKEKGRTIERTVEKNRLGEASIKRASPDCEKREGQRNGKKKTQSSVLQRTLVSESGNTKNNHDSNRVIVLV